MSNSALKQQVQQQNAKASEIQEQIKLMTKRIIESTKQQEQKIQQLTLEKSIIQQQLTDTQRSLDLERSMNQSYVNKSLGFQSGDALASQQ